MITSSFYFHEIFMKLVTARRAGESLSRRPPGVDGYHRLGSSYHPHALSRQNRTIRPKRALHCSSISEEHSGHVDFVSSGQLTTSPCHAPSSTSRPPSSSRNRGSEGCVCTCHHTTCGPRHESCTSDTRVSFLLLELVFYSAIHPRCSAEISPGKK